MSDDKASDQLLEAGFSRQLRLLTSKDFKKVFSDPVKIVCPPFTLLACPNHLSHARLGLIVAKKNVRFAVSRNRLKRLARESFRLHQQQLPSYDLVLLARRGSSDMPNEVLFEHLDKLWSRAKKKCQVC